MIEPYLFQHFFYNSPNAFFFTKSDGTIIDANKAASEIFKYSTAEIIDKGRDGLFKINNLNNVLSTRVDHESIKIEATGIRKDGTEFPVEIFSWLLNEDNNTYVANLIVDISQKKENINHIEMLYLLSVDMIGIANNGRFLSINPAGTAILGYEQEELLALNFLELIHPDDLQKSKEEKEKVIKGEHSMYFTNRYKCKNGDYKWLEWNTFFKENKTYFVARDVTAIMKQQEHFKLLESVVNHANDGVVITKAEPYELPGPEIVFVNDATLRQTGYLREEVLGKTPRIFQGEKTDRNELNRLKESLKKLESCEIEVINYKKDGDEFWVNISVFPLTDDNGVLTHWVSVQKNVTERKNIEKELVKSNRINQFTSKVNELVLRAKTKEEILDNIPKIAVEIGGFEFVWFTKPVIETGNLKTISYAGNEAGYIEFIQTKISEQSTPFGKGPAGRAYRNKKYYYSNDIGNQLNMSHVSEEAVNRGFRSCIAIPVLIKEEVKYIINLYNTQINYFNNEEIGLLENLADNIAFALDALYNKNKREETEVSLNKLSMAIEQSSFTVVISNMSGEIEYVNTAGINLTGYSQDELIGKKSSVFKTGYTSREEYEQLWNTITNGKTWNGVFCNKKKNGELYWESAVISPVFNAEGIITNFIAVKEDISERKKNEAELLKLNQELQSLSSYLITVREEERKHIAKEIHDELGQTLTLLKLDISWVLSHLDFDKGILTERLQQIKKLTDETVQTSRRLYNYIYPQMIDDIGLIETIRWHSKSYLKNQHIVLDIWSNFTNDTLIKDTNTCLVLFRVYQETFTNILRYAAANKVVMEINIEDRYVIMIIKDNGVGFNVEEVDTKLHHGILGMRERVKALNGTITIESELGKGTTTNVRIPIVKEV